MFTGFKVSSLPLNVYFTDKNILKNGDPIKLNFEGLKTQKCNTSTARTQKKQMKKMGSFVQILRLLPQLWSLKCQK